MQFLKNAFLYKHILLLILLLVLGYSVAYFDTYPHLTPIRPVRNLGLSASNVATSIVPIEGKDTKNAVALFASTPEKNTPSTMSAGLTLSTLSPFAALKKPIYTEPSRLYALSSKINVSIQSLGTDDNGTLLAPADWQVGGWYYKSAKPGQIGNIIINAHYDDSKGMPAAFWELKNIRVDDKVFLVDSLGREYTYKVVSTFYVDINDPSRLNIFDDNDKISELTLITCGGFWIPSFGTYNKRLIVKAHLFNEMTI